MKSYTAAPTDEYLKTKVMTASPEQLHLMLYDGAIRFCEQGRQAILDKKIEAGFKSLSKVQDIILEFVNTLNDEADPENCARMRELYMFCYRQIVQANMNRDIGKLDDALKILRHMRETWVMVMEKLQEERTAGFEALPAESYMPTAKSPQEILNMEVGSTLCVDG